MDMELHGKFGQHADLAASIGLTNLGDQFWNLSPAELVEDCIILGEGMLTDTGALAIDSLYAMRKPKMLYGGATSTSDSLRLNLMHFMTE